MSRGNIDYDQIQETGRQGGGSQFQMFGGGSTVTGAPLLYDANGNAISGAVAQLVPTLPADATKYLDGTGAFTTPSGGSGGGILAPVAFASMTSAGTSGRLYPWLTDAPYAAYDNGASWDFAVPGIGPVTPPPSASWSWDNQGSATIDSTGGFEYLSAPRLSAVRCTWRYRTAPATPYTVTALFKVDRSGIPPGASTTVLNVAVQLIFRQSTTGKAVTMRVGATGSITAFTTDKWTTSTSFSANYAEVAAGGGTLYDSVGPGHAYLWLRIQDDGTNLVFYWSIDGQHWKQFDTRLRGDFMTVSGGVTGPDQIGFGAYVNGSGADVALLSWKIT